MPNLFSVSEADNLNWEDNSVETILSFETLEHLQNPKKALQEYYRVCQKNIILTVPNCEITAGMDKSKLIYSHWQDRTHVQFFNMSTIINMVQSVGFKVVKKDYINQIYLDHLIREAFNLSGLIGKSIRKLLSMKQKRHYYLTCLIVAQKN
ncbi:MAG: methyltransferase domain-containing protein [Coleofasciculus sp. G1-WW12-02]|uniref:methyltransferase domain-containing protein n=1 Tax=Coleofasciculus sp. G1-WW12-02 TaxID=3068483 RepID=UPI0032F70ED2